MQPVKKKKRTLGQRRALHAWNVVNEVLKLPEKEAKDYSREARKLPPRIMNAGLGQALAFIKAKSNEKEHVGKIHDNLTDWVIKQRKFPAKKQDSLLESIIEGDSEFLKRATEETLAYLAWLVRFLESEIGEIDVSEE